MISPNLYPQPEADQSEPVYDELDRLVQRALKALVCEQRPPERVWNRIKVKLEQEKSSPNRFQISWLPLVLQPALTISLIVLGAIGLQISTTLHDIRTPSRPSLTPLVAKDYVEEDLTSIALAMMQDKAELRLAKTHSNPTPSGSPARPQANAVGRSATSAGELGAIEPVRAGIQIYKTGPVDQAPLALPRDPFPNVLSPEGRALMAELSLERLILERLVIEDRIRRHSNPYERPR